MSPATNYLLRNTSLLDSQASNHLTHPVDILIEAGRIQSIAPTGRIPARTVELELDCSNTLTISGLVNAHTHSPATYAKGTVDADDHPRFMWRNQGETVGRTEDEIYNCTLLAATEMLESGTTSVIDHYPEQPFGIGQVGPAVQAYKDIGMRASIALRIFDEPYYDILPSRDSDVPPELARRIANSPLKPMDARTQIALCRDIVRRWHEGPDGQISVMLAPSAPLRCSDGFLCDIVNLAREHGLGIHTHLLETPVAVEISQRRYGKSLVRRMHDLGMLGEHVSCAHGIYVSDEEIGLLADSGTTVVHNPTSNLRIGDGVAPILKMKQAGVALALGTDGSSTNDNLNMFEEVKLACILHRHLATPMHQWLSATDALHMANSAGSAATVWRNKIGTVKQGLLADLTLIDLTSMAFTPLNNALNQLVFADVGRSVKHVFVNGRQTVSNGQVTLINRDRIMQQARVDRRTTLARNEHLFELAQEIERYID